MVVENKSSVGYLIRQAGALTFAFTLAWDYCRDPEVLELFSIWTLGLHFIYFQLPLKSRALAFFHSTSFTAAGVMLASYCHLLMWKPSLETDRMEKWDVPFSTILLRTCLIHFAPILFHSLDISFNQMNLIISYQSKPRKFIYVWSFISFGLLGIVYDFTFPDSEEMSNLPGIDFRDFLMRNRIIALASTLFACSILYSLILRRAYTRKRSKSL